MITPVGRSRHWISFPFSRRAGLDSSSSGDAGNGIATAAALAVLPLTYLLWRNAHIGSWFDEFATMWFSDPHVGLVATYQKWSHETNPPLFYLIIYFVRLLRDAPIADLRLVNAAAYVTTILYFWSFAARFPAYRTAATVALILYSTSGVTDEYFLELRSYFWQFSCCVVLCLALLTVLDERSRPGPLDRSVVALAILLLVNLHFTGALLAALVVMTAAAYCWVSNQWKRAAFLLTGLVAASVPAAAFVCLNFAFLAHASQGFWIVTSGFGALADFIAVIRGAVSKNVVVSLAILPVILLPWRRVEALKVVPLPAQRAIGFASCYVLASLVFLALLWIANLRMPIVVLPYVIVATAPLILAIALASAAIFERWPVLLYLAIANGAAVVVLHALVPSIGGQRQEDADGKFLAQISAACPDAKFIGVASNNDPAYAEAYRETAQKYHIKIEPRVAMSAWTPERNERCPTVLWALHSPSRGDVTTKAAFEKLFFLRLDETDTAAAVFKRTAEPQQGLLFILAPKRERA